MSAKLELLKLRILSQSFVLPHPLYGNYQFISWAIVLFFSRFGSKTAVQDGADESWKTNISELKMLHRPFRSILFSRHFRAPTRQYSNFLEFSRAFQPQRRDILGAKMQNQSPSKLLYDWSFRRTVRFCHGNRFSESTVDAMQSFTAGDKSPLFMQK